MPLLVDSSLLIGLIGNDSVCKKPQDIVLASVLLH